MIKAISSKDNDVSKVIESALNEEEGEEDAKFENFESTNFFQKAPIPFQKIEEEEAKRMDQNNQEEQEEQGEEEEEDFDPKNPYLKLKRKLPVKETPKRIFIKKLAKRMVKKNNLESTALATKKRNLENMNSNPLDQGDQGGQEDQPKQDEKKFCDSKNEDMEDENDDEEPNDNKDFISAKNFKLPAKKTPPNSSFSKKKTPSASKKQFSSFSKQPNKKENLSGKKKSFSNNNFSKKKSSFKAPSITWNPKVIEFPDSKVCRFLTNPRRVSIPKSFADLAEYKDTFEYALIEDINLRLLSVKKNLVKSCLQFIRKIGKTIKTKKIKKNKKIKK